MFRHWISASPLRSCGLVHKGDGFRCLYEAYLTDYRLEPKKSVWEVE